VGAQDNGAATWREAKNIATIAGGDIRLEDADSRRAQTLYDKQEPVIVPNAQSMTGRSNLTAKIHLSGGGMDV